MFSLEHKALAPKIDPRKDPMRYVASKNHKKIKNYLIAFKLKVTDDLDKDCMSVAKNKAVLKSRFDAKKKMGMTPKSFEAYEASENYDNDLNAHFNDEEAVRGFEGWEGDNYDFLPLVAGLGAKLAKKGIGAIAKKLKGKKAAESPSAPPSVQAAAAAAPPEVHSTVRNNVLEVGMSKWLDTNKQKAIDKMLAKGKRAEETAKIKAELIKIGISPKRFRNFEDGQGNYSFNGKAKDLINDILTPVKETYTKAATQDAMPKIIGYILIAFVAGLLLKKFL